MTVRDKLIEILDRNCGYTEEERAEVVADRLINSGLIKDDSVYTVDEQEITIRQAVCPKCGYFVGASYDSVIYSYCPGCGIKIKPNRSNNYEENS